MEINQKKDCLFCNIGQGNIPSIKVYENDNLYVMMDIFPESKGHLLIVPKNHFDSLLDISDDMLLEVTKLGKVLSKVIKKTLFADGIKIAQFSGESAGQTVFHYHMHVVPAYNGKEFSRHANKPSSSEELESIAKIIRIELKETLKNI